MCDDLNLLLSNLNVFYRKLQNYHWNITGADFFTTHEKLEEYYNSINEQIDEVAEVIVAKKYHVSVEQLKQWNGLRSSMIRIGQSLKIVR